MTDVQFLRDINKCQPSKIPQSVRVQRTRTDVS
uniref:Uncharacterized protein n=1 Tax=Anguilla anguilla TaxID=7936 RepID=A0A0E9T9X8_ANGAN